MVEYVPPPKDLSRLNVIQRYMQKGELERQDWLRLIALVVAYFVLRPYIQKAAKWFFGDEQIQRGEQAQKEYMQRRVAKVGANEIRSGKKDAASVKIDEIASDEGVVASGSNTDTGSKTVNRKNKSQRQGKRAIEEQLLDWDDEPAGEEIEGGKTDVKEWLEKWDK